MFQTLPIQVLAEAHIEMKHRITLPFLLQLLDSQALEQLLPALKVAAERGGQQGLTEATRTAQEDITRRSMRHTVHQLSLVHVHIITLP